MDLNVIYKSYKYDNPRNKGNLCVDMTAHERTLTGNSQHFR